MTDRYNILHTLTELASRSTAEEFAKSAPGFFLRGVVPSADDDWGYDTGVITADTLKGLKDQADAFNKGHLDIPAENVGAPGFLEEGPFVVEVCKHKGDAWSWVSLGRAGNSDLAFRHPSVSKLHAQIGHTDERGKLAGPNLWIADVGSKLGTFLNGKRLAKRERALLCSNDRLVIGEVECYFQDAAKLYSRLRTESIL